MKNGEIIGFRGKERAWVIGGMREQDFLGGWCVGVAVFRGGECCCGFVFWGMVRRSGGFWWWRMSMWLFCFVDFAPEWLFWVVENVDMAMFFGECFFGVAVFCG